MKTRKATYFSGVIACALAIGFLGEVRGQAEAPVVPDVVRIRRVTEIGRDFFQKAPVLGNRSPKAKDWGVLDVVFDVAPEWIDEMTVTYTVMLQNAKVPAGEAPFSLLTLTVPYRDVAQGRERKVGAVVLPVAMERYGQVVGVAVQMYLNGKPMGEKGAGVGSLASQPRWWANSRIVDSQNVKKRAGYLVERAKSPFALVEIDSYEASR